MIRIVLICCVIPATAALAAAQPPPEPPRKLVLSANPPPSPVLRLPLLPELRHQEPGNAWPLYQKAGELLAKLPPDGSERNRFFEQISQWEKLPYAELPRDEARKILDIYREPLALLEKANRCESCNCDIAERIRKAGAKTLLPEVQQMRSAVPLLSLKARLELAEDHPEKALRTLQVACSLGQRLGETPTLISMLVGVAITTVTNNTLQEVLTHPRTPNLYWSLTNLPQPFLSLRKPLEGERLAVCGNFPGLTEVARDMDAGPLPEEQLQKVVKAALQLVNMPDSLAIHVFLAQKIRGQHETAKQALIDQGRPRDKIEAWPPLQVALMFGLLEFDEHLDEMMKWDNFPYYQAEAGLEEARRKLRSLRARPLELRSFPLTVFLLPAVDRTLIARSRLERQLASLRCVEAIRLYASGHGGKLPAALADVTEVPLPICPLTGKSFEYRLQGDTAFLSAPEPPKSAGSVPSLAYEITIRR